MRFQQTRIVRPTVEEGVRGGPRRIISPHEVGDVQVALSKIELQRRSKQADGKGNAARQLWELKYEQVMALKLESRIDPKPFR